jgi:glyoxylase-like metal-dependent hydrolase (beta-lactamase superfamily II)
MMRWQIGKVRITKVVESGPVVTSARFLFTDPPPDLVTRHAWLKPHFANEQGKLLTSIHSFVIESAGRRIVVDTCVGNDKVRNNPGWNQLSLPFLQRMTDAGFAADSIDTVLCTHLHVDHVGWNTQWLNGGWQPTFKNARYLFARTEWEHWYQQAEAAAVTKDSAGKPDDILGDSVKPIFDAGLADLIATDHRITEEVWLEPTPGHTPGHVSVRIQSEGRNAVITGDLMHHPIQCSEPDRAVAFDTDSEMARQTRRRFLACCAHDQSLVLGTHFSTPTAGQIVAAGDVWRFKVEAPVESRPD